MDTTRVKIERVFGETMYEWFKNKKYGIKSCKDLICPECAFMLKELYNNKKERHDCDTDSDECTYNQVRELINTL